MASKPIPSAERFPDDQKAAFYQTLAEWHKIATEIATEIADKQDTEKKLRGELCAYFKDVVEGSGNKIALGHGKTLQLEQRINRSVDEAELDAAISAHAVPTDIVNELFTYKPNLSVGAWKDLDDDTRKKFATIITEKPGTPSLKIITPKR